MKYYFDTEFIEGFKRPPFGKQYHFIDLISIGLIDENGRVYEAISSEYNYKDASDWVKENVIIPMYLKTVHPTRRKTINESNFNKYLGLPNDVIAREVKDFINRPFLESHPLLTSAEWYPTDTEFYAYYADYDWVLLCSLFGRMIDLPKGFPMYCRDLKQSLDEMADKLQWYYGRDIWANTNLLGEGPLSPDDYPATLSQKLDTIKKRFPDYPQNDNEHSALDDAKWNKALHAFIAKHTVK